ncbi:hypothetical protein [Amycolatopsis sp. NPDC004378]
MSNPAKRPLARNNKPWASARVTPVEALIIIATLLSVNVLWLKGFDVDLAIVKSGSAATFFTLAITAPHRVMDIVRLRIIRDITQSSNLDDFHD